MYLNERDVAGGRLRALRKKAALTTLLATKYGARRAPSELRLACRRGVDLARTLILSFCAAMACGWRRRATRRRRHRSPSTRARAQVGATADGDLQVGWLRASAADPVERPVFLASRLHDKEGNCALRVGDAVVSRPFHASPTLYVNADFVLQSLFLDASLAKRFQRLEELRTPLNPDPPIQGEYESRDVAPLAGSFINDSSGAFLTRSAVRVRPRLFFSSCSPSPRTAPSAGRGRRAAVRAGGVVPRGAAPMHA